MALPEKILPIRTKAEKIDVVSQPAITCLKLPIKTLKQGVKYIQIYSRHWRRSVVFIVNFEYISYLVLVFLLLTLSR